MLTRARLIRAAGWAAAAVRVTTLIVLAAGGLAMILITALALWQAPP